MYENLSDDALAVMQEANALANLLGHEYVTLEDILYPVFSIGSRVVRQTCNQLQIMPMTLSIHLITMLLKNNAPASPGAVHVIRCAKQWADIFKNEKVEVEHLLLGVLQIGTLEKHPIISFLCGKGMTQENTLATIRLVTGNQEHTVKMLTVLDVAVDKLATTLGLEGRGREMLALTAATELCENIQKFCQQTRSRKPPE